MNQAVIPVKELRLEIISDDDTEHTSSAVHLQSGDTLTFIVSFVIPDVFTGGAKITVKKEITINVV